MSQTIPKDIFESFLQPGERGYATHKLANLGIDAIPILELLFSGEAKNRWGVSYSKLGTPLDCGLVTVQLLGAIAKPLEPFIRAYLQSGYLYAAPALGAIGQIDEASIIELADCLEKETNFATEAAYALCCCGVEEHEAVTKVVKSSPSASQILSSTKKYCSEIREMRS